MKSRNNFYCGLAVLIFLFSAVPVWAVTAQCVQPPSGMVAWLPGENNGKDIVGGNTGTEQYGATYADGMVGRAFSFDGLNDYVFVPNTSNIDGGTQATYDAWVFPTATDGAIFGVGDSTQPVWTTQQCRMLHLSATSPPGSIKFYMDCGLDNAAAYIARSTAGDYPINNWYFVTGVFNNGSLDIYVNGSLDNGTISGTGGASINTGAYNYVWMGALVRNDQSLTAVHFNGLLDEVEIFNRALTAGEIAAIYNAGSAGKCWPCTPPPSNMTAWWPGEGNANDIKGGYNGTLLGNITYAPGKIGQAFSFDGSASYVQTPNVINGWAEGTIDLWTKFNNVTDVQQIFAASTNTTGDRIQLYLVNANPDFEIWAPGWQSLTAPVILVTGQWYHMAASWGSGGMKLYLNGVLAGTNPNYTGPVLPTDYHRLGATYWLSSFMNGLVDELEIFNRALSDQEIADIYNAGYAGKCKDDNADPAVTKTGSPGTVTVGENITYTLTIINNGACTAMDVTLTDNMPAGVAFVSADSTQGTCTEDTGTVTCNIGDMYKAEEVTVTIVATANSAGAITNTVAVSSNSTDPNLANNESSFQATVNRADTTTTITGHSPDPSVVGEVVTADFTVTSTGGAPAGNVTVSDGDVNCTATVATGNCLLTFTTAGTRTLTAAYVGDSNFNGSTSTGVSHTVEPHYVTANAGADGSLDPTTPSPASANHNETANFKFNANTGYHVATITDTCGGPGYTNTSNSVNTYTYTTPPITADCGVNAIFAINRHTLMTEKAGSGTGTVTSADGFINCGADCEETYDYGTTATLNAAANQGSVFLRWEGDADCADGQVTIDTDKTCRAVFSGLYTVSGRIRTAFGMPLSGVTVILEGDTPRRKTTTDYLGRYRFDNVHDGSCTITPGMVNYRFNPSNMPVKVEGANVTNLNFKGTIRR